MRAYAAAKSQADAEGALALCAPDFSIETIPFGTASKDRAETAKHLALLFAAFPDYRAETEGLAVTGDQVAWWGRVSFTALGPVLGHPPTGKRADLPAFSVFDFRGGGARARAVPLRSARVLPAARAAARSVREP